MIDIIKFNSLLELMETFNTEEICIKYLENLRWKNGVVSPFDPKSKVYVFSKNRYICKNTGKIFNVKTKTIFENTKISLRKWFMAIWLLISNKKGIPSTQLARDIKVTQKTAWFMLQRIRVYLICMNKGVLKEEVEADETFVGGKNKNRHKDKKVKQSQGRSFKDKTPVLGMLQRKGNVIARVVKDTSQNELTPKILEHVDRNAILYTDEWHGYNIVNKLYEHYNVDHSKGIYGIGNICTNAIEGFWTLIKRGYIGIYHYISPKYLQRYVNEFVFRYNTRKMSEHNRFNLLLCNIDYKMNYKVLTA
ncbi:MAG: IS1595 family transposase [Tannerella sp.]|jgi:transposase-like protein|nr:IS1595 family transposase [Tannerella sp.]